ncbi:MAG: DUF2341 domain-containing protein [Myxococcota bacterium]
MRTPFVLGFAILAAACFEDSDAVPPGDGTTGGGSTTGQGSGAPATGTSDGADSTGATSATTGAPGGSSSTGGDASTGASATAWSIRLSTDLPAAVVKGESELANVPVLVRLTPGRFDYAAAAADGSDLRFVSELADDVALPHEVERWEPDGTSLVWVRVPELGATPEEDEFWLLYGDTGLDPWSDPRDVWSNGFAAVWHFGGDEEVPAMFVDSTAEAHVMTPDGASAKYSLDAGPGGFGTALVIDEPTRLLVPDGASLDTSQPLSLEAWVRPSVTSATSNHREIVDKPAAYRLVAVNLNNGRPFANFLNTADAEITASGPAALPASTWSYLVGTYDGQTLRLYVDGTSVAQMGSPVGASTNTAELQVGVRFAGRIDELRIAGAARSAAWIEVQRSAMLDELLDYGAPVPFGAAGD